MKKFVIGMILAVRITSYNVCYTKLLRMPDQGRWSGIPDRNSGLLVFAPGGGENGTQMHRVEIRVSRCTVLGEVQTGQLFFLAYAHADDNVDELEQDQTGVV